MRRFLEMSDSVVQQNNIVSEQEYYNYWVSEKGLWSLNEAIFLFCGIKPGSLTEKINPALSAPENIKLMQGLSLKPSYYNAVENRWCDIEDLAFKHIATATLKRADHEPGLYFYPADILAWLKSTAKEQPPSALSKALKILKGYAAEQTEKVVGDTKNKRYSELHHEIAKIWKELHEKGHHKVPAIIAWDLLKNRQESIHIIISIEENAACEEVVYWVSASGTNQEMKYRRFANIISEFNKGKKQNYFL